MNARRLRHDLDHLVSWLLLGLAVAAIGTGIVADAWDLNDFRWHRWAGYGLAIGAVAHVGFTWRRLLAYTRFRARHLTESRRRHQPVAEPPMPPQPWQPRRLVSRRGLFGAVAGAGAGLVAGRYLRPAPIIPGGEDLGLVYHEWSKPGTFESLEAVLNWGGRPAMRKTYPDATVRPLPPPQLRGGPPIGDTLQARRSVRQYSQQPLSAAQLSRLLALSDGLRAGTDNRRTAPSAGALYPIEVYPVLHDVEGFESGVYHYDPFSHTLSLVEAGDKRGEVVAFGLHQDFLGSANVAIYLTLVFQRLRFKYRDRAYRYGLLEAGHIGQNIYLAATSMGLGACAIGAFLDDQVNDLLHVDAREEAAVYLLSVGTTA